MIHKSPRQLDEEQWAATGHIDTRAAFRPNDVGSQLKVPQLDTEGNWLGAKTVHARFCPELSMTKSVWQGPDGTYYHIVDESRFMHGLCVNDKV